MTRYPRSNVLRANISPGLTVRWSIADIDARIGRGVAAGSGDGTWRRAGDARIDGASVAGAVWARAGAGFFGPAAGQSSRETLGNSQVEG